MTISSRTPEGVPARCPICGSENRIEASILIGDATCPQCGALLWFLQSPDKIQLFDAHAKRPQKERVIEIIANQLGVNRDLIANRELDLFDKKDSLDLVELIMELEEELDGRV